MVNCIVMNIFIKKLSSTLLPLLSIFLFHFGLGTHAAAETENYGNRPEVILYIDELVSNHKFDRDELEHWFGNASKKKTIIDAISRPAERTLTWAEYRKIFLTPTHIGGGEEFWANNKQTLEKAEKEFGVPAEIMVAILGVETLYGKRKGSFRVIDALSTLAFDYPPRSLFFRRELTEFLLLSREQKQDPLSLTGSYAGAMGYGQFIPSSYRAYAIDYNGDGFADIWNNTEDAIGSIANYFKHHNWKTGEAVVVRSRVSANHDQSVINQSLKPSATIGELRDRGFSPVQPTGSNVENDQAASAIKLQGDSGEEFWLGLHNFYVITRYNRSRLYAMAVWQLSQEIAMVHSSSRASML